MKWPNNWQSYRGLFILKIITQETIFVIQNIYDPQALNYYSFERNNPYTYEDEDGKNPLVVAGLDPEVQEKFAYKNAEGLLR